MLPTDTEKCNKTEMKVESYIHVGLKSFFDPPWVRSKFLKVFQLFVVLSHNHIGYKIDFFDSSLRGGKACNSNVSFKNSLKHVTLQKTTGKTARKIEILKSRKNLTSSLHVHGLLIQAHQHATLKLDSIVLIFIWWMSWNVCNLTGKNLKIRLKLQFKNVIYHKFTYMSHILRSSRGFVYWSQRQLFGKGWHTWTAFVVFIVFLFLSFSPFRSLITMYSPLFPV